MRFHRTSRTLFMVLIAAVASLATVGSAQAKLTGAYTRFANCPYTNLEVKKCLFSVTESGEVVLGSKKVPIVNPVTLQGGTKALSEGFAPLVAATNGVTLSKTPQPVPGGLAGLVNCKEISEPILRGVCELTLENGVTGASSTLELAGPASEVKVNEFNVAGEEGVSLRIPVKIHLENPFLGSSCYVASDLNPIIWELTTGETSPPAPNEPIHGFGGEGEFLEENRILEVKNAILVDNAWSAPGVTGCGGPLVELLLDPVVNVAAGLPAKAGKNTAILKGTLSTTTALAVRKNNEENP